MARRRLELGSIGLPDLTLPLSQTTEDIGDGVIATVTKIDPDQLFEWAGQRTATVSQSPYRNPASGERATLATPVKPVFMSNPAMGVAKVTPDPLAMPGYRTYDVAVRDGIRFTGGEGELYSTGEMHPTVITGWSNPEGAANDDGSYAYTAAGGGYSAALEMSGFGFNIPPQAVITGIKVTVKRRLV